MADLPRRGLGALLQSTTGGIPGAKPPASTSTVALTSVRPNPHQPRKQFEETALRELADSIKATGLIQPIVVRSLPPGDATDDVKYEIIAGERRWRASQIAEQTEVPVVVKQISEATDVLLLSLIENLQREDLNPIEEAVAFQRLSQFYKLTQDQISQKVGKSRAAVANAIRILELPENIRDQIAAGGISTGHAKVLLSVVDESRRDELAERIVAEGLSVRQLERMVDGTEDETRATASKPAPSRSKPPHIKDLEAKLRQHLGTKVSIQQGEKRGKIVIEFYTVADFDRITGKMGLTR
jgi:ParB family transcriptional regulator, chromosome partitioning protein